MDDMTTAIKFVSELYSVSEDNIKAYYMGEVHALSEPTFFLKDRDENFKIQRLLVPTV